MDITNLEEAVVSPLLLAEEVELTSYWTDARMESALPFPFPKLTEPTDEPSPLSVVPGEPASGDSRSPDGEETSLTEPTALDFSTSPVRNLNVFPYQAVGKLFMTINGNDRVGSAYVIGESTIGTAGHCVHDGNWATNVLFAARFNNGSDVGKWAIKQRAVPPGWTDTSGTENRNYAYDLAVGIASRLIRPTTGKLGWMANYPANQGPYTQIGYPAESISGYPFDGQRMWESVGDYISGTAIIQADGNMTGGCSGGPWAVFQDNRWRVNGVNSHRLDNPNHIYSPAFGNAFINLMRWMEENGGD